MSKKRFTVEEIIGKLREAEILLGQGLSVDEMLRKVEVSGQTYYRWSKEYGGMRVDQPRKLKEVERENGLFENASKQSHDYASFFTSRLACPLVTAKSAASHSLRCAWDCA